MPARFRYPNKFSNIQMIQIVKCETSTSRTLIFLKLIMVVEYFKRNNFPFGKEFKIQKDFEL
jgi:hypothetical protein